MNWQHRVQNDITRIEFDMGGSPKWEQYILLKSDAHWDNPKSDQRLQEKHMKQALERNAPIMDFGDFFCAMQGKYDKRSSKSDLREEHAHGNYLDLLVETAVEFHKPYAKNIVIYTHGNHETSVKDRHETDLTERLVSALNREHGTNILKCGISGVVRFVFNYPSGNGKRMFQMYHHHGYGGGAPVTKGVIQTNRMAVYSPDMDFVVTGHTHGEWCFPIPRFRVRQKTGEIYQDEQVHLKLPTYKQEFEIGTSNWHMVRGAGPKPIGAVWLKFYTEREPNGTYRIKHHVEPAK